MKKILKNAWIPCIMIIGGLMLVISSSASIFRNIDLDSLNTVEITENFQVRDEVLSNTVQDLTIEVGAINEVNIHFTDSKESTIQINADPQTYDYSVQHEKIRIESRAKSCFLNFGQCSFGKIDRIDVILPTTFNGKIHVGGASFAFNVSADDQHTLRDVKLSGANVVATMSNITSDITMNGVNVNLEAKSLGGELELEGLNVKGRVENPLNLLDVSLEGIEGNFTVKGPIAYSVRMSGLSTSFLDEVNGFSQTNTMSHLVQNHHNDTLPIVMIETSGLNQNITIEK